ncbi:MFS family permease [Martelella radicis]|uniref:MFS family permease n=1 Tax=Martelella radicis TaxID=1397476 RepID=A0A7W6PBZ6_9HYPH|nr:MFS transporter [Martelella radicis]MBB4124435.1 MFS family permease [Martelella radicis]
MTISSTPSRAGYPFVVLAVIASATLMIVLDASIINIALPRAQAGLGLSDTARPWVITAYALSFGGLLLLGGRLGDRFGHRRMFLLGLTGFALASGLGGAAASGTTLILAPAPSRFAAPFRGWTERLDFSLAGCSRHISAGVGASISTCPSRWLWRLQRCARFRTARRGTAALLTFTGFCCRAAASQPLYTA